ncbi:MAG: tetratricopeptide repeat protein, partial [Leptolyngbya sp. SIO1D8]|nr:tetratricopeptide repeat protein [Leptolyngbya sp. SIO1D8]
WNRRAILYYVQKRYWQAITDCDKVLELVPYHFGALHGLGLCHAALGNYLAAIQALRRALEVQPFASVNERLILECTAKLG